MVTEKYLLRAGAEWQARQDAIALMYRNDCRPQSGRHPPFGANHHPQFQAALQAIIPWRSNRYTESLIRAAQQRFGDQFWGFWMLGGMSGGMGFIVDPAIKTEAQTALQEIMDAERHALQDGLPFASDPCGLRLRYQRTWYVAELLPASNRLMPVGYYALHMPRLLRADARDLNLTRRRELDYFGAACLTRPELARVVPLLFNQMLPHVSSPATKHRECMMYCSKTALIVISTNKFVPICGAGRIWLDAKPLTGE
jgi:hypothetical protein